MVVLWNQIKKRSGKGRLFCNEFCTNIDADLHGKILSIKNPLSGKIKADEIIELQLDKTKIDPSKTQIICSKIGKTSYEVTDKNEI